MQWTSVLHGTWYCDSGGKMFLSEWETRTEFTEFLSDSPSAWGKGACWWSADATALPNGLLNCDFTSRRAFRGLTSLAASHHAWNEWATSAKILCNFKTYTFHRAWCSPCMVTQASRTKFRRQRPGLINKFQAGLDYKVRLKKQSKPRPYNLKIISFAFLESQRPNEPDLCQSSTWSQGGS